MKSAAILALTGGGMMARFSTCILEHLQNLRNKATGPNSPNAPLPQCFDIMAGTSAGALCVAGLVAGRTPAELSELFDQRGALIFPKGRFRGLRHLFTAKYSPRALEGAVDDALHGKDLKLGEIQPIVAFPAFNETKGVPVILTNADPAYLNVKLSDAVLASAAAPTYFPAHRIPELNNQRFVDGGVYSNAPDLAALTLSLRRWPSLAVENLHLVSIGTTNTSSSSPYDEQHKGAMGILEWAMKPRARILKLTMRGQVDHAMALLSSLHLASFVRIDELLESDCAEKFELDDASTETLKALAGAGEVAFSRLMQSQHELLAMILARNRPSIPTTQKGG